MNQIPQDVDSFPREKKYPPMWLSFVSGFILAYTVGAGIGFAVLGNTGLDEGLNLLEKFQELEERLAKHRS